MKKIHTNSITYKLCGSHGRATEQRRAGVSVHVAYSTPQGRLWRKRAGSKLASYN